MAETGGSWASSLADLNSIEDWTVEINLPRVLQNVCTVLLIFLIYDKCVDYVIWTGCRILKLALTFEMFIHFFVFLLDQKEGQITLQYIYWNHPTFSISWRCSKIHFTETLKKHNKNVLIFDTNFNIQRPNDMIRT